MNDKEFLKSFKDGLELQSFFRELQARAVSQMLEGEMSSGQSLVARSGQSVTLNAGTTVQSGASALFEVDPSLINNNPNADMNRILGRSFNATGQVVSESKVFYDDLGKVLQAQSCNLEAGVVLASEPLYSVYGAAVGSTLPAPIGVSLRIRMPPLVRIRMPPLISQKKPLFYSLLFS